jgi:hypothetical protein
MGILNQDIVVFSLSKLTGHASSRFGWIWMNDFSLAAKTIGFSFSETFGISIDSTYRATTIIENINAQTDSNSFFNYTKRQMNDYWIQINQLFAQHQALVPAAEAFQIVGKGNTFFAWVRCPASLLNQTSCGEVFAQAGIIGRFGNGEMGIEGFVRLNVNLRLADFDSMAIKLRALLGV